MAGQPLDEENDWQKQLEDLKDPVTIVVHQSQAPNEYLEEFKPRLAEITEKFDLIGLKYVQEEGDPEDNVKHLVDHFPAFVILDSDGNDHGIRFYGCPTGNIFNSFISTLIMLSKGEHSLEEAEVDEIKALEDTDIQVLVTPNAPSINTTIDITHSLSFVNEKVSESVSHHQKLRG